MRALLLILLVLLGSSALFGGWVLMLRPDGSLLHMSMELLARSPFTTFFWPGLILFTCFGLGAVIAGAMLLLRRPHAPMVCMLGGFEQMIWIVVQAMMIRQFHPFQLILFLVGATILFLGMSLSAKGWIKPPRCVRASN